MGHLNSVPDVDGGGARRSRSCGATTTSCSFAGGEVAAAEPEPQGGRHQDVLGEECRSGSGSAGSGRIPSGADTFFTRIATQTGVSGDSFYDVYAADPARSTGQDRPIGATAARPRRSVPRFPRDRRC